MKKKGNYGIFRKVDDYPKGAIDLARRRVAGLLHYNICSTAPLASMLESAYLQGIVDAVESLPYLSDPFGSGPTQGSKGANSVAPTSHLGDS